MLYLDTKRFALTVSIETYKKFFSTSFNLKQEAFIRRDKDQKRVDGLHGNLKQEAFIRRDKERPEEGWCKHLPDNTDVKRLRRTYWSFDRKIWLDDEAKAQKLISVKCVKCAHFILKCVKCTEMHTFHSERNKTADFHSNLLVSWELLTEGYQGRPVKCTKQLISTQIC